MSEWIAQMEVGYYVEAESEDAAAEKGQKLAAQIIQTDPDVAEIEFVQVEEM